MNWFALALGTFGYGICVGCAPAPRIPAEPTHVAVESPWRLEDVEVIGLEGATLFAWDRARNGSIVELSANTGQRLRRRTIRGLRINGPPGFWAARARGYVAQWDAPTVVRETRDRELEVAWSATGSWLRALVIVDQSLLAVQRGAPALLVRMSMIDGHLEWSAPLDSATAELELMVDDHHVYVVDARAGTSRSTSWQVRAFDLSTGARRWTFDLASRPAAAYRNVIVKVFDDGFSFVDGSTGLILAATSLDCGGGDPRVLAAGDSIHIACGDQIAAYDVVSGTPRWHAPIALDARTQLVAAGDLLFTTTAAGGVAAVDRTSGRLRWEVGVGLTRGRLFATSGAVVVSGSGVAAGFRLPPHAALERATIHGRVTKVRCGAVAGSSVLVGGRPVRVEADGSFRAAIEARGHVMVQGQHTGNEPSLDVSSAVIPLVGRHIYQVPDLTLSVCANR